MERADKRLRRRGGALTAAGLLAVLLSCSEDPAAPGTPGQPDPRIGVTYALVSVDGRPLPQMIELVDTQRTVLSGSLLVTARASVTVCGVDGSHWSVIERHEYEGTGVPETAWPGLGGYILGPTNNHIVSVGLGVACNWSRTTIRGDTILVSRNDSNLRYETR
jgi:hypothetical protein